MSCRSRSLNGLRRFAARLQNPSQQRRRSSPSPTAMHMADGFYPRGRSFFVFKVEIGGSHMEHAQPRDDKQWSPLKGVGRPLAFGIAAGLLSGLASALFLNTLEWATRTREANPPLLWLLPLGGLFIGFVYHRFGGLANRGNNIILEEIYEPGRDIPFRMAPLGFVHTIVTHLFGGTAGGEGNGVQMAGRIAGTA